MAYLEKEILTITTSTGGACTVARSIKAYTGYLHGIYYTTHATNPIVSGSSSIIRMRIGTTAGRLIVQSSSQFVSKAVWIFPYKQVGASTKILTETSYPARIPLCQEKIVLTKTALTTSGSTEQGTFTVYIEGSGVS